MSALKDLMSGGADCSGTNNPLAKLMPQISGASAMREQQFGRQGINAEQDFRSMQMADEAHAMDMHHQERFMMDGGLMSGLPKELEGMSLAQRNEMLHHQPIDHHPGFVEEFQRLNIQRQQQPNSSRFHMQQNDHMKNEEVHEHTEWGQEFSKFRVEHNKPGFQPRPQMFTPMHRPFVPMIHPVVPAPIVQAAPRQPSMDNAQWASIFEKASELSQPQPQVTKDDMARTAELLLNNLEIDSNPKFRDSQFLNMVKGFSDGELKVEGDRIVNQTGEEVSAGQGQTSNIDLSQMNASQIRELTPAQVARNWTEEFIHSQDELYDRPKEAITDLSDEEFDQAFKFSSWVDEYKDQLLQMNDEPDNINWDELEKDWKKYNDAANTHRSSNPLYDNYLFSKSNPFLSAPEMVLESAMASTTLAESIPALEAHVQKNPEDASAWHKLGLKQQENEREASAIAALRQAITLDPTICEAWLALSVSYTNENCTEDAYDALEAWIANNPSYKHIMEGRSAESNRYDHVFNLFLDAVRSNVSEEFDPEVQIGLGVLLNISEEYDKAVECFQSALSTRPQDYLLWNKLGATLANSQEPSRAMEAYFRALELNPTFIRARYNLAISSINLGQYHEAAEHLLAALQLQSNQPQETTPSGSAAPTGAASSHVWDTLRMTLYMLDRTDLVEKCDAKDLNGFKDEFSF